MIEHQRWLSAGRWKPCPSKGEDCVYDVHRERPAPKRQNGKARVAFMHKYGDRWHECDCGIKDYTGRGFTCFYGGDKNRNGKPIKFREVLPPARARWKK